MVSGHLAQGGRRLIDLARAVSSCFVKFMCGEGYAGGMILAVRFRSLSLTRPGENLKFPVDIIGNVVRTIIERLSKVVHSSSDLTVGWV